MDACTGYEALTVAQFEWPNGTLQFVNEIVDWEDSPSIIINTTEVCLYWSRNETDSPYNFTYDVVKDKYTDCCQTAPTEIDEYCYENHEILTLYYWADPTWNTSWWNQFKLNPLSTDPDDWASWNFTPSDPNSFTCGRSLVPPVYQVSHSSAFQSSITSTDLRISGVSLLSGLW